MNRIFEKFYREIKFIYITVEIYPLSLNISSNMFQWKHISHTERGKNSFIKINIKNLFYFKKIDSSISSIKKI